MEFAAQLEEVLKLVAETGDRCVVLKEGHEPFVVMNVTTYRELLEAAAGRQDLRNLSEGQLLERINQQIAEWREHRSEEAAEYDLNQFQVSGAPFDKPPRPAANPIPNKPVQSAAPAPKLPQQNPISPRPAQRQPAPFVARTRPEPLAQVEQSLPVVSDEELDEYRLEPL